jgi:hypothetical protein
MNLLRTATIPVSQCMKLKLLKVIACVLFKDPFADEQQADDQLLVVNDRLEYYNARLACIF